MRSKKPIHFNKEKIMKHLKKLLFAIMILAMLLSACGQGKTETAVTTEGVTNETVPTEAVTSGGSDPITLQVFIDTEGTDAAAITDSRLTKYMEERFNIKLDVVSGTTAETLTLMLASGDYPKLIYRAWYSMLEVVKYGELGVFVPLEDYIAEYAPNVTKAFEENPALKAAVYAPDGHIYMMPFWEECFHCTQSMKFWINTEWLKAVGMDMPTTTEEFEKVLIAFRDQDPNGNGKKDEIPLTGFPGGWNAEPWNFLMNAFIYNTGTGTDYVYINGDKVAFAPTQPEWKEGLKYINSLYDQGLIDPQAFTQTDEQFKNLCLSEEELVGVYAAGHLGMGVDPWVNLERANKYEPVLPLKGPAGVQVNPYFPNTGMSGSYAITNKASKEEAIAFIKLLDWHYSQEGSVSAWFGPKDVGWTWAAPGDVGINGDPAIWKVLESASADIATDLTWNPIFYMPAKLFLGWASSQDIYTTDGYERRLYLNTKEYEKYKPEHIPPTGMYMTSEDSDAYSQMIVSIQNQVYLNSVAFIAGEKDIDTEWDAYVDEFDKLGLTNYLALLQKYYKP
jgi:putative aldouronate transport system substrate-binding protein